MKVLRQPVQVPAAAHGPQKLARLARLLDSLLEPAPHPIEPSALEAHIGVAGRGEVPATGDAAEVRREALVPVDVLERVQELVEVADPAALRLQHAPRAKRRIEAREQLPVVQDPVERRVGEDGVNRLVEVQVEQVGDDELGPVGERLPRPLDHRLVTRRRR